MFHNLAQAPALPRPDSKPGGARAEGALPRLGARVLLVVHQPAAAALDLLLRLHGRAAGTRTKEIEPYALFMFCGILPWTWFSSSLLGIGGVLISGGNLIKKVLFPAEILPIVTVLSNMVHFFLGLPILLGFLIYYRRPITIGELALVPGRGLSCSCCSRSALALILSALTVHFRDIKDLLANLLTFWFFATPIIYPMTQAPRRRASWGGQTC